MLTAISGIAMFVLLVIVELRIAEPMLDLRLYRERMFRNSNIVQAISFGGMAGLLFLLPQFLQNLRGLSALQSGLATFPQAIGMMLAIRVVGRLYPRIGLRRLIIGGLVSVTVVSLAFVEVDLTTSLWWIRLLMFLRGISMSFAFIPLQAATYANISGANTGRASALYSTQRQVGGALGVAVLATIWLSRTNALTAGVAGATALQSARGGGGPRCVLRRHALLHHRRQCRAHDPRSRCRVDIADDVRLDGNERRLAADGLARPLTPVNQWSSPQSSCSIRDS